MINIDNKTHDRLLQLIDKYDLHIHRLCDQGYHPSHPTVSDAIARLQGAQAIFDIINGNT
jgi:hypothetical protein